MFGVRFLLNPGNVITFYFILFYFLVGGCMINVFVSRSMFVCAYCFDPIQPRLGVNKECWVTA
jgi:hypothetical protein